MARKEGKALFLLDTTCLGSLLEDNSKQENFYFCFGVMTHCTHLLGYVVI